MSKYGLRNRNESGAAWVQIDALLAAGKGSEELALALGYTSAHAFEMCHARRAPITKWRRAMLCAVMSGVPAERAFAAYASLKVQAQPSRHRGKARTTPYTVGPLTPLPPSWPACAGWRGAAREAEKVLTDHVDGSEPVEMCAFAEVLAALRSALDDPC